MKIKTLTTLVACSLFGLSSLQSMAEGNGGGNGFLDAAEKYAKLAIEAEAEGNAKDAAIYLKLSQIKQSAAVASKNGEKFSWDEYHKLAGQLSGNKGGKKGKMKKKDGGINEAAERYAKMAKKAREKGNRSDARIYDRLSQIKLDAAAHKGPEKFDWSEYHKLTGSLNKEHHKKHGDKKHKHDKKNAGNGFLKTADEYTAKANTAMAAGDEETARIYTELAGMKREAAAAAKEGKGYDWKKYFKLKKQLK